MLTLDAEGRSLFLLQLNVPDFVDSPWEALLFGKSGWGVGCGVGKGEDERENCSCNVKLIKK